ncbi:MAG TPA: hypothetical protein VJJ52_02185 [Candidatus Nanoarchaeia archaeon]|nr:hypothetical protein [Candidatus Nanoarchaeia archaeon]
MKKLILFLSIISVFFILACTQNDPVACTEEAKICPDGSAVGRTGPKCEFADCPASQNPNCDYETFEKKYAGKSPGECSVIKFQCEQNRIYFEDKCGCGCKLKESNSSQTTCGSSDCGPQLGMPNYLCPDGKTTAGPTGRCLKNSDGTCGWEVTSCPPSNQNESLKQNYCTAESRKGQMCIALYKPVCGWFDPARIQCIKYPCANTFSNSCVACQDDKVLYWTEGECQK